MASQAATCALPPPLHPYGHPSDIRHMLCRLGQSRARPLRLCSTTHRSTYHARERYHPVGYARGGNEYIANAMEFATAEEERGGRELPRPPGLPSCHPRPATNMPPTPSPTTCATVGTPDAKIPAAAREEQ
jgi:hypothetical protein